MIYNTVIVNRSLARQGLVQLLDEGARLSHRQGLSQISDGGDLAIAQSLSCLVMLILLFGNNILNLNK
jgi:hypothetical protein